VKLVAQVYYHNGYKIAVSKSGSFMLHAKFAIQKISKNLHVVQSLYSLQSDNKQAMTNTTNVFINTHFIFQSKLSQVAFRIEPTIMADTVGA
jgi:hypothetical protein